MKEYSPGGLNFFRKFWKNSVDKRTEICYYDQAGPMLV